MEKPIYMHINYCEQGQTFPELCHKAVDWGFDGIEFRSQEGGGTAKEPHRKYLERILKAVEAAGLNEVSFGYPSPNMMLPDAAARKADLRSGIEFYRIAKDLFGPKLSVCNAFTGPLRNPCKNIPYGEYESHGSSVASDDQWQWAVEGYQAVGDALQKIGLHIGFETHMCYLHDTPEAVKKLVDKIGRATVGVNLDYGNMVYFKTRPALKDVLKLLGKRIYYVHLKNSLIREDRNIPCALGEGDIDHREYLRTLKKMGYEGPLCLEAPREGDREWYARKDLAYVKSVIADLSAEEP